MTPSISTVDTDDRVAAPTRRMALAAILGACQVACGGGSDEDGADRVSALDDDAGFDVADGVDAEPWDLRAADSGRASALASGGLDGVSDLPGWILELPVSAQGQLDPDQKPLTLTLGQTPSTTVRIDRWYQQSGRGWWFAAPAHGAMTSRKAGGARCELKQPAAQRWNAWKGANRMELLQCLEQTPAGKRPVVVIGQVHEDENVVMIKYRGPEEARGSGETGEIWAEINHQYGKKRKSTKIRLDDAYPLGADMTVQIVCDDGEARVLYTRLDASGQVVRSRKTRRVELTSGSSDGYYFKLGTYTQKKGVQPGAGEARLLVKSIALGGQSARSLR